jgi:serine/threonine protein kinase
VTGSESADPLVGTELAGYRIEAPLGSAGAGALYRACDPRRDRSVALELLDPGLTADERFRKRFLRESKLVASLEHPNILPVYGAGEAAGLLYVAMGDMEGTTLADLLAVEGRRNDGTVA